MKEATEMERTECKGLIFNIQKFSLNDGPGIRTVVFFKGCPLKCTWCANPESQSRQQQTFKDGKIAGEWQSLEEVLHKVMQDEPFYRKSGGGVTLSGGESLLQPDFALALLQELKKRRIHTAMETTGFASPEVFRRVTAYADLLLFDVKHWDEEKHRAFTGVSNAPILANLRGALAQGKEVLPRLPVIPGVNDSTDDAREFSRLLRSAGAHQVQLLPFHQFGENKYRLLGQEYSFAGTPALHQEELAAYRQTFLETGIEAFF